MRGPQPLVPVGDADAFAFALFHGTILGHRGPALETRRKHRDTSCRLSSGRDVAPAVPRSADRLRHRAPLHRGPACDAAARTPGAAGVPRRRPGPRRGRRRHPVRGLRARPGARHVRTGAHPHRGRPLDPVAGDPQAGGPRRHARDGGRRHLGGRHRARRALPARLRLAALARPSARSSPRPTRRRSSRCCAASDCRSGSAALSKPSRASTTRPP